MRRLRLFRLPQSYVLSWILLGLLLLAVAILVVTQVWRANGFTQTLPPLNVLLGVTAHSPTDAWAVGETSEQAGFQPLIEHWNGAHWNSVPSPNPSPDAPASHSWLEAVTVPASTDAWAVGGNDTSSLLEHWDGPHWQLSTGISGGDLAGVAALGSNDVWVVGTGRIGRDTLTAHWDGNQWLQIPSPNQAPSGSNQLRGVAMLSSRDVWAVGFSSLHEGEAIPPPDGERRMFGGQPLLEHWDGTQWSLVASPALPDAEEAWLTSVGGRSATDLWAAGTLRRNGLLQPLLEHWDGSTWHLMATTLPQFTNSHDGGLNGIAVPSPEQAWTVGTGRCLASWDGISWQVRTQCPSSWDGTLYSITALSTQEVWAVGTTYDHERTVIQHWNGRTWQVVASPSPGGTRLIQ